MMRRTTILLALMLAGCMPATEPVAIHFQTALACVADANGLSLTDLRFFVHDVALLTADGKAVRVALDAAPPWQSGDIALVDLEDGEGTCDTGSPLTHATVTGRAPAGAYTGLRFTLGVPFALNHADPVLAAPPLDQTAMHWHWLAGYKFLRVGITRAARSIWLHVGSTGCDGKIGAVSACAQPNRATIALATFNAATDVVTVDVAALFKEALAAEGPRNCEAEPDNEICAPMLRHLGLGDAGQDVFRAMAR